MTSHLRRVCIELFKLTFGLAQLAVMLLMAKGLSNYIPLPASILGLMLCCAYCVALGGVPKSLEIAGNLLLKYMPLFFVPLVVAIPIYWPELKGAWFACLVALVLSTLLSMSVTAQITQVQLKDKE